MRGVCVRANESAGFHSQWNCLSIETSLITTQWSVWVGPVSIPYQTLPGRKQCHALSLQLIFCFCRILALTGGGTVV